MDYSLNGARKRSRELRSLKTKFGHFFKTTLFTIVVMSVPASMWIGGNFALGAYRGMIADVPKIDINSLRPVGYATNLYDLSGNKVSTLVASDANRTYVTIDKIPEDVQHAFVAIEDRNFYKHHGIDYIGMARALAVAVKTKSFSQGASTITQQLVKNSVFPDFAHESSAERWKRKIQEQQIALDVEKRLDKESIIELYLNTINMGQNTLGIQAASQRYFGKDSKDLTLSEGAVLAAIPQNPTKFNPISHPDKNAERRTKVLGDMLEEEWITEAQYEHAMSDKVYQRILDHNKLLVNENTNTYFTDAVVEQVLKDLQDRLGYTEQQAYYTLYAGGLTIYTTQDQEVQSICDNYVNSMPEASRWTFEVAGSTKDISGNQVNINTNTIKRVLGLKNTTYSSHEQIDEVLDQYEAHLREAGYTDANLQVFYIPQPQLSMSIIDQKNGQVRAIIGGRGTKTTTRTFNRATEATRQPGSTFKVLAAFLPAFDTDAFTLNSTQVDEPFNYKTGRPVNNYYKGYKGIQTLRSAIEQSLNIVTVKTLTDIGEEVGFNYLQKLGFTTLVENDGKGHSDKTQALALGGITYGVTNVELCAAYASIANEGLYNRPSFYTKVIDHNGVVLLDQREPEQVFRSSTAYMLTSAMQDVLISGTGKVAAFEGQALAGKTGTTSDNKDVWFAGYSPYYTCVAWAGYDNNLVLASAEERAMAKDAWREVMKELHKNLPYKSFDIPNTVQFMEVCDSSHEIATDKCKSTHMEPFDKNHIPEKHCTASHYVAPAPSPAPRNTAPSVPALTPEQIQQIQALQALQSMQGGQ